MRKVFSIYIYDSLKLYSKIIIIKKTISVINTTVTLVIIILQVMPLIFFFRTIKNTDRTENDYDFNKID